MSKVMNYYLEEMMGDEEWLKSNGYERVTQEKGSWPVLGGMILVADEDEIAIPCHSDHRGHFEVITPCVYGKDYECGSYAYYAEVTLNNSMGLYSLVGMWGKRI